MSLSPAELVRYSRHLSLTEVGRAGQQALRSARVLIIGAGGLGSPAALYLAAAGVGTLGLADFDRVDESNLQRQILFDTTSLGTLKTQAARERLIALNPHIQVIAHQAELAAANVQALFSDYDLIIDGSDRSGTHYLVGDACVLYRKSLVTAAVHRFEGQLMSYVPERGPCYRCAFPHPAEGIAPNCAEVGVLGVLPGMLGTLQATEAIKLIVGMGEPLLGRLLLYDALALRFQELRVRRRADCAVCGTAPSIRAPQDAAGYASVAEQQQVPALSPQRLAQRLGKAAALLIDVREVEEFALGHLPQARNVPLAQLESQLAALPHGSALVFLCRTGVRSLRASALARRHGFEALHLEGGLIAWREQIDPSLPL